MTTALTPPPETHKADDATAQLERRAVRSVRWASLAHFGRRALQLLTSLILTRMLERSDFGLATAVMVIVSFVDLVQDFGMSSALVQKKHVGRRLLSSVFWFQLSVGAIAGLALWVGAPLVVLWTGDPRTTPLLGAAAALFLVRALTFLPRTEHVRNLDFATLGKVEFFTSVAGAVFAVTAAVLGAGVWALILQPLVAGVLLAGWLWRGASWRPQLMFAPRELRGIARHSGWLTLYNLVDFFHLYGAHLLIAYYIDIEALAVYYLALRITAFPSSAVSESIGRVLFPYLSRAIANLAHAKKSYLSILSSIGLYVFPAVVGFGLVADLFFDVVCGVKWHDCAMVAVLLTPVGLARAVATTTGALYQATGRTELMFRWSIYHVAVVLVAFAVGVQYGVNGVAAAYSCTLAFSFPLYAVPARLIGVRVREMLAALSKPLLLCTGMAAAVLGLRLALQTRVGDGWMLALAVASGALAYAALTFAFARGEALSVWRRLVAR